MADHHSHGDGIERRRLLRTTAAAGLGSAVLSGSAAADDGHDDGDGREFYQIGVYLTSSLVRRTTEAFGDPWRAQERAKTYIEGAFSRIDPAVEVVTPKIPAPLRQHAIQRDFIKASVCDHHETVEYDTILQWFRDWLRADCTAWPVATHSNILLTDGHNPGGGLAYGGGRYASAASGRFVARLPEEYQRYGYQDETPSIGAMWVTLHEIGHNLLTYDPENDGDGDGVGHHDMAEMSQHPDGNTNTAMGMNGDVNNCGTTFDKSTLEGRELTYSACSVKHFKPGAKSRAHARSETASDRSVVCEGGPPGHRGPGD
jgi:hypothetical protein